MWMRLCLSNSMCFRKPLDYIVSVLNCSLETKAQFKI